MYPALEEEGNKAAGGIIACQKELFNILQWHAYSLCWPELDEKTDTALMSVG